MLGQDYQFYFNLTQPSGIAESETHYYFWGPRGVYLCGKSKSNGEVIVLCNKPDCLHDVSGEWGQINRMFAYGDQLYVTITNEETTRDVVFDTMTGGVKDLPRIYGMLMFALGESIYYYPWRSDEGKDYYDSAVVIADLQGESIGEELNVWTLRLADLGKPDIEGEVFYEYVLGENG